MSGAKRVPSSSVKKATLIGWSVAMPCVSSVSITSRPASTPRLPSKRPPVATVSMCDPVITGAASGSRPGPRGDDVADLVDRHGEAEVAHPADHEVAALAVDVGEREAGAALLAVRTLDGPDLAELLQAGPQPTAVDAQVVRAHLAPRYSKAAISPSAEANARRPRRRTARRRARRSRRWGRRSRRSSSKSFDSHPNDTVPAEADVAVGAEVLGDGAARPRSCRRAPGRGAASSDVSSVPPWMPMPSSSAGRGPALVGRHAGVGEERHQPVAQSQLAVGHAEQRRVAAVAVEERPAAGPASSPGSGRCRRARRAASSADSQNVPGDQACSLDLV